MLKYILKRLFISIFILFGVSLIIYTLVRLMPNDYIDLKYAEQLKSGAITPEQIQQFKNMYGIGDNSFKGVIGGYFKWFSRLIQGDLGRSFKYEKPVAEVIGSKMWISFAIAVVATILQFLISWYIERNAPVFRSRLYRYRIHDDRYFTSHLFLCGNSDKSILC